MVASHRNLELFLTSPQGKNYAAQHDASEVTKTVVTQLPAVTLESILRAYAPVGAAVVIRIDAEGSEYAILEQALARSHVLCEYGQARLQTTEA